MEGYRNSKPLSISTTNMPEHVIPPGSVPQFLHYYLRASRLKVLE